MRKYDYLIVGAGLFGSVCARELADRGKRVLVIEKRDHIGGNCYTENVGGIEVHRYGAHIFHTSDKQVWDYVNRFAEFYPFVNSPLAAYKGELYNLPFNMNTFYRLWGTKTPQEAKRILEKQRHNAPAVPANLEEQALKLAGKDIYEKLIKGYTEKQWGRDCRDLPAFILKRVPLRFTFDNNYFNDIYQGIPADGYTAMFEKLLEGTEVRLNTDFLKERGRYENIADTVIYTGTIDEYFGYKYGALEYRSLRFETERLETENYQGNAVVNYTEREVPYTRIIEHKHFSGRGKAVPFTVITREYPQSWAPGEEAYYPVNDERNERLYEKYRSLAGRGQVVFGGRLGMYKYSDMDKIVLSALHCVTVNCLN